MSFDPVVYQADLSAAIAAGTEFATAGMLGRGKKERAFRVAVAPLRCDRQPSVDPEAMFGLLQRVVLARESLPTLTAAGTCAPRCPAAPGAQRSVGR